MCDCYDGDCRDKSDTCLRAGLRIVIACAGGDCRILGDAQTVFELVCEL